MSDDLLGATGGAYEILVAARGRIDKPQKWCKGDYLKGSRMCLAASLVPRGEWPEEDTPDAHPNVDIALGVLRPLLPSGVTVADFNDAPERKHADVMALLDKAIEQTAPLEGTL